MSKKKYTILIIVMLSILTFNVVGIFYCDYLLSQPRSQYDIEVLGGVFKTASEPSENIVVDIDLIPPPRQVVVPGEKAIQTATITNTSDCALYFRSTYKVDVKDADGKVVESMYSKVKVNINDDWSYRDGYWYYTEVLNPGQQIPGLIESIEYSEDFAEHNDYRIYVPVLFESVEVAENALSDIDYWPNKNINKIDYTDALNKETKWTVKASIELW